MLKEKGYPIARCNVAKYREQPDIPVAQCVKNCSVLAPNISLLNCSAISSILVFTDHWNHYILPALPQLFNLNQVLVYVHRIRSTYAIPLSIIYMYALLGIIENVHLIKNGTDCTLIPLPPSAHS